MQILYNSLIFSNFILCGSSEILLLTAFSPFGIIMTSSRIQGHRQGDCHPGQGAGRGGHRHWGSGVFYDRPDFRPIPDSVVSIGFQAFFRCTSLSDIAIPRSVDSIGAYAFFHTPVTIHASPNSTAHRYATDNRIPFAPWKSSMPYGTAAPEPSQSPLPSDSGPIGPYSVVLGLRVHWLKSDGPPLRPGTIIVPRWGINCLESNLSFRHGKSNYVPVGRTGLRQIQFGLQKVLLSIRAKQTTKGSAFSTLISQSPPF